MKDNQHQVALRVRAEHVFEDRTEAARWLKTPLKAAGKTPLELAVTAAGAKIVEKILGRIEHGVFS